jgi:type II secretory pathway pseudopilin PulG
MNAITRYRAVVCISVILAAIAMIAFSAATDTQANIESNKALQAVLDEL